MRITRSLLILFCGIASLSANAQMMSSPKADLRRNTAYVEFGGFGLYYSLNYQRHLPLSKNVDLVGGVLLAPVPMFGRLTATFTYRAALQAQILRKINRHELGAGATFGGYTYYYPNPEGRNSHYQTIAGAWLVQLGYGYTSKKGLYAGAYFTPCVMDYGEFEFTPTGGLRIGYRF